VKDKKEQVEQFSPLVVAAGDQTLLLSFLLAFLGNVRLGKHREIRIAALGQGTGVDLAMRWFR